MDWQVNEEEAAIPSTIYTKFPDESDNIDRVVQEVIREIYKKNNTQIR